MATRTLVALLAPIDGTVLCIGTGILAGERGVLVHPALSRRLHAGTGPEPVQVAACSWQSPTIATADVAAVHVSPIMLTDPEGGPPEPVVGLELAARLEGHGDGGFLSDADVLAHLRDPFAPVDPLGFLVAARTAEQGSQPSPSTPAPDLDTPPVEYIPPKDPVPPPIVSSNVLCRFLSLWC